jgi:hypothetical protein
MKSYLWSALTVALLAFRAIADTPPTSAPKTPVDTITVEATRERDAVRQQVSKFVSSIAVKRYEVSLADWQREIPICFLVGGLARSYGSYFLARLSEIAASVGAPLASEDCKPNFYVVVSSDPNALLKAWNKRDVSLFDSDDDFGGVEVRRFLESKSPVRAWYNAALYDSDGKPIFSQDFGIWQGMRVVPGRATRIRHSAVRDLRSVIVLVDAPRAKGVSYSQLAAYIAMVGLAEIKTDANVSETPSILQLFADSKQPAPAGLSKWDEAFLKGLYRTEHLDQDQLGDIKTEMVDEIAPRR